MSKTELRGLGVVIYRRAADGSLEVDESGGEELVQPCYRALAMGDQKGVPLAQEAHLQLLEAGGLPRELFLEYGVAPPSPDGTPWISVCIDDLVIVDEVPESKIKEPGRDTVMYNQACRVYEENGVAPKPEKKTGIDPDRQSNGEQSAASTHDTGPQLMFQPGCPART